jgi:hypothetical protein
VRERMLEVNRGARWERAVLLSDCRVNGDVEVKMDESKRQAVQFLEKEIKTYIALALFLSKEGIKERVQVGNKQVLISPTYYRERMREARKIVNELRRPN